MMTNMKRSYLVLITAIFCSMLIAPAFSQEENVDFKLSATFSETTIEVCVTIENGGDKPILFPGPFHFRMGGLLLPTIETPSGEAPISRPPRTGGGGAPIPPHWKDPLSYEKIQAGNQLQSCDRYELTTILADHIMLTVEYKSWLKQELQHPFTETELLIYDLLFRDANSINLGACKFDIPSKTSSCS